MKPDELRTILEQAEEEYTAQGEDCAPYARALLKMRDAVRHYEKLITWNTGCQGCAALLDKLLDADRRAQLAEAALCVAACMTQKALEKALHDEATPSVEPGMERGTDSDEAR